MITMTLFVLVGLYSLSRSQNSFMPNLPLGEYHVVFDKVYRCESTKNHSLLFNIYHSKKTSSITELKGNISMLIPFDDTLTIDVNFSSWGSTGGWIPNAYIFNSKMACSNLKKRLGNGWFILLKGFNMSNVSCPIPAGIYYITSGIDCKKLFEDNSLPKVYFYGKYKVVVRYKNVKNIEVGCTVLEINLLRPWETAN